MIQSVHNEQSDKKKPVQIKYIWANMMICGFAPDFSHSEKQSRPHAPIQSTHGYGGSTVLAYGFSARDRKTRQNVGGRTDGDRTGHQAASKAEQAHYHTMHCV